jgi:WD40 repeat protein
MWDLKKGGLPVEEREKGQDIFSLTSVGDHLFYGCRNHHVYPLNFKTMEEMQPFTPPHFDVVTSLSVLDNSLISGSRDKNLRCWDTINFQAKPQK